MATTRFNRVRTDHRGVSYEDEKGFAHSALLSLLLIREAWANGCSFEDLADGFGPGAGTQGDWSAIRDSSGPATERMLERALNHLFPGKEPAGEGEIVDDDGALRPLPDEKRVRGVAAPNAQVPTDVVVAVMQRAHRLGEVPLIVGFRLPDSAAWRMLAFGRDGQIRRREERKAPLR